MLYNFDFGGAVITQVPFLQKYRMWCRMLAQRVHPNALSSIKNWLSVELQAGIITTSWLPGADWYGTPYQAIYDALQDEEWSALFFGLICCDAVLDHVQQTGQTWGYGHYEKDGVPIRGRTYFECHRSILKAS